jgi:DivIVA domain-containing protein
MDLTPRALREVEFREKLRGYHPAEVVDFVASEPTDLMTGERPQVS